MQIDSTVAEAASSTVFPASSAAPAPYTTESADRGTRDRVARMILERGPLSAARISALLSLSAAGVRRHLDRLVDDGMLVEAQPRPSVQRGRGRPARVYALTDAGRSSFPHAYDDLATAALSYLRETGGAQAVRDFAQRRAELLAGALSGVIAGGPTSPVELAEALTAAGYASSVDISATGVQVCQHHCPVAHVAAQFPELCRAETQLFERVLGTHVQRLATIAHGDGVCTTHIPHIPAQVAADTARTSPAGMASPNHRFHPVDRTTDEEYRP